MKFGNEEKFTIAVAEQEEEPLVKKCFHHFLSFFFFNPQRGEGKWPVGEIKKAGKITVTQSVFQSRNPNNAVSRARIT